MQGRVICWFSCGDASAVASALALKKYQGRDIVVARIYIPSEHGDNDRFAADCERWFQHPITVLRSEKYADTWDVWEDRKYIAGPAGAPCSNWLKKKVREGFQRPDDLHVFGYTHDEKPRAKVFQENHPELDCEFPLIDRMLNKPDCHALVSRVGIEIPMMYRLGFNNNNCIGCPKGGAGYWNHTRKVFPDTFERMSELEERLGGKLIKLASGRVSLRELDPDIGNMEEEEMSCSLFCSSIEAEIGLSDPTTL